jgi:hypothetical protein
MPLHPKAIEFAKSGLFAGLTSFEEKARWERDLVIRGVCREVRSSVEQGWLIREDRRTTGEADCGDSDFCPFLFVIQDLI